MINDALVVAVARSSLMKNGPYIVRDRVCLPDSIYPIYLIGRSSNLTLPSGSYINQTGRTVKIPPIDHTELDEHKKEVRKQKPRRVKCGVISAEGVSVGEN